MGQDVFEELSIADNKLLSKLDNANNSHKKILDIFARRVTLYKECADKQDDPIIKAIIDAKKSVIMSDMGLLSTQYEIQSDILRIISRIVILERKFSDNQGRKPSWLFDHYLLWLDWYLPSQVGRPWGTLSFKPYKDLHILASQ